MYEFLAPWGVFVPATCAVAAYYFGQALRRKQLLSRLQAPASLNLLLGSDIVISDNI